MDHRVVSCRRKRRRDIKIISVWALKCCHRTPKTCDQSSQSLLSIRQLSFMVLNQSHTSYSIEFTNSLAFECESLRRTRAPAKDFGDPQLIYCLILMDRINCGALRDICGGEFLYFESHSADRVLNYF